jgi:hypothetical protein
MVPTLGELANIDPYIKFIQTFWLHFSFFE